MSTITRNAKTSGGNTLTGNQTFSDLTASRAAIINSSKVLTHSSITETELGYLSGVTSAIQTQLDGKADGSSYVAKSGDTMTGLLQVTNGSEFTNIGVNGISISETSGVCPLTVAHNSLSGAAIADFDGGSKGARLAVGSDITNKNVTCLSLEHGTSGSAAAGFGVGMVFLLDTFSNDPAGTITTVYTDATSAAEDADMIFGTVTAGARTEKCRIAETAFTLVDAYNFAVGSTTGTKIGTATTQKIGFWNATPIVQPSTTGTVTGYTGGGGTALTHSDTFTGNTGSKAYTIGDIVKALKDAGIMAAS